MPIFSRNRNNQGKSVRGYVMNQKTVINAYLKQLVKVINAGDAREESFYPTLVEFIQRIAQFTGQTQVQVTAQPRPTEAGNPDFRVWDGRERVIGYIEAKRPDEELLDHIEESEQLHRYRQTFPNLILTNFLEFRLYRDGNRVDSVLIGRPVVLNRLRKPPPLENAERFLELWRRFFDFSLPRAFNAASLAMELAKRTRFLREIALQQIQEERQNRRGDLLGFFQAFQKYLIGTLTDETFADLYAQTITYGLFAARTRTANGFNRRNAFDAIPRTIGVLRDLFRYISLEDLPAELEWIVDDIAQVLAVADAPGILSRYYREGKGEDPVVHFYETFLAHYDPQERERRGVYYTPEPVVSYIIRSIHYLLKSAFHKPDGLASNDVTLLDPAAGTMTFIARAAQQAVREFEDNYGSGSRIPFIREHILRNFYAFELMVAPYAIGHLKMSFFLDELGYHLADDERMPFYLTNTLDMSELEGSALPGLSSLAEESHLALQVKRETPILVILGNPPYSGHSANQGEWIRRLIDDYKQVDGVPLGEKNPKWLHDDYVKFLRFAEWKIAQSGQGVVGMITNHSYLDNPTFRGMRQHLMQTFDEIYVLNLHGNSLKRETCPDGSKDENVFDIRQGVAIAFLVKRSSPSLASSQAERGMGGEVHYAELWGRREQKYEWLRTHELQATPWQKLQPQSPFYFFVPRDRSLQDLYQTYPSLPEIFPLISVGIVTARDNLTIHWTPREVWTTVLNFSRLEPERARQAYQLGKDARDWKVTLAQEDLRRSGPDHRYVVPILYRPFDVRYTYYTGNSRGFICRPRPQVMRHMLAGENVALAFVRQVKASPQWKHCFITDSIAESCLISNHTSEIGYLAPLYLYPAPSDAPSSRQREMFAVPSYGSPAGEGVTESRQPNLNPQFIARLEEAWGMVFDPTPTPPPRKRGGGWREGSGGWEGSSLPSTQPPAGVLGKESHWRTPPALWEKLKPLAREKRRNPTAAEEKLWEHLRRKQPFGYKFRRQHAIGPFIVDFYCHEADLIIEVDGPIHQYSPEEDAIRQEYLQSLGFRVLRFQNERVLSATENVLEDIQAALASAEANKAHPEERTRFTPKDVFHYIYAVLFAPTYRQKYAEFLRLDFPRLPFTANPGLFAELSALGKRLVDLHLLHSSELNPSLLHFEGKGDNQVAKGRQGVRYDPLTQRVYINPLQYFAPVPQVVWEYTIGGYQVCEKWLKERAGRTLTSAEVRTYCAIVTALIHTIAIQDEIERLYSSVEEDTI